MELDKNYSEINFAECPCFGCKWHSGDNLCKAFNSGIPIDILSGENDHTEKHPDQKNNIVFEPVEEKQ